MFSLRRPSRQRMDAPKSFVAAGPARQLTERGASAPGPCGGLRDGRRVHDLM
jgi:hypothetical protein